MKKLLDIIKKAVELKKDLEYTHGQIQILDYVIKEKRKPEDMKDELMAMYESSIEVFQAGDSEDENSEIKVKGLRGAADILAWLLDIPQKVHKNNIKKGRSEK